MIDTVLIYTPDDPGTLTSLSDVRETVCKETGEVTTRGRLRNLTVKAGGEGFTIFGSLPRFQKGSNIEEQSPADIERTIENIGNLLNTPLDRSSVYRLDVGSNLIMSQPVKTYLNLCGEARYYTKKGRYENQGKNSGTETVEYMNQRRTLSLYDKMAEMQQKDCDIPLRLQGKNVLRYEMQLKRKVKPQMGKSVRAGMLYNDDFLGELSDRWFKEFERIRLYRERRTIEEGITAGQFRNRLALSGIDHLGGEEEVLRIIEEARANGTIAPRRSYRLASRTKSLLDDERLTTETEGAEEIRSKIRQAAMYPDGSS